LTTDVLAKSFGSRAPRLFSDRAVSLFRSHAAGRPTVTTVRGRCDPQDGKIHTDSTSKIITALIYIDESWEHQGGRLRLLRSATDLSEPTAGTLVAFKRSNNSWHGHERPA
jgi:SM-20-related protein